MKYSPAKIVVTQELDLFPDQIARLQKLGDITFYDKLADSHEDWVERVKGYDVICSGKFGLKQKYQELQEVFISVPFVGVGFADPAILRENGIILANSPGSNKEAVSEWIVGMVINLRRRLPEYINNTSTLVSPSATHEPGLMGTQLLILGKGNIGITVGAICERLSMEVSYFRRGDDLYGALARADMVVNTLTQNAETIGLLNAKFFNSMKQGAYFVSVADRSLFDENALFAALDGERLAGAAIDCMGIQVGDITDPYFQRLAHHSKVMATPHIAYKAISSARVGNDMMIDNIEAYLKTRT
jgi:phosphoglycerate dehydrogenase-like enzyme